MPDVIDVRQPDHVRTFLYSLLVQTIPDNHFDHLLSPLRVALTREWSDPSVHSVEVTCQPRGKKRCWINTMLVSKNSIGISQRAKLMRGSLNTGKFIISF